MERPDIEAIKQFPFNLVLGSTFESLKTYKIDKETLKAVESIFDVVYKTRQLADYIDHLEERANGSRLQKAIDSLSSIAELSANVTFSCDDKDQRPEYYEGWYDGIGIAEKGAKEALKEIGQAAREALKDADALGGVE